MLIIIEQITSNCSFRTIKLFANNVETVRHMLRPGSTITENHHNKRLFAICMGVLSFGIGIEYGVFFLKLLRTAKIP